MKINFYNNTNLVVKGYQKIIKKALAREESDENMEIIFVSPEEIQELNKTYRNIDRPTDVLSFPNDDDELRSLGDIFINVEQAFQQADEYGHSIEREIAFLAVHGYLHLVGYDHETPEQEKEMFEVQEEILRVAKIERK